MAFCQQSFLYAFDTCVCVLGNQKNNDFHATPESGLGWNFFFLLLVIRLVPVLALAREMGTCDRIE